MCASSNLCTFKWNQIFDNELKTFLVINSVLLTHYRREQAMSPNNYSVTETKTSTGQDDSSYASEMSISNVS